MKKTVSINLANQAFQIEEEAYLMLNKYLEGIRQHFLRTDPDGEIAQDIEGRIAELFAEKQRLGYQVITLETTSEVIQRIGNMGEISDEAEENGDTTSAHETHTQGSATGSDRKQRKLYRDISRKWVAGVLAGIGAYIDVQPWMIRVLFVILLFMPKLNIIMLLLYIACAFFINPARTINDRLEMEGEMVSPGSIWRKITEEANDLNNRATSSLSRLEGEMGFLRKGDKTTAEGKPSRKSGNGWMWGILAVILILTLVIGACIYFLPGSIWSLSEQIHDAFAYSDGPETLFENLAFNMGPSMALAIIPIILLFTLLILAIIVAIFVLPVGVVLKSNMSMGAKLLFVLAFVIFLWVIF